MKVIFSGLEGSGKSLYLAMTMEAVAQRNAKFYLKGVKKLAKKYGKSVEVIERAIEQGKLQHPVKRPIVSNLKFSKEFVEDCEKNNVPIEEWHDLEQLVVRKDCDVVIDEVGNYFDSRLWADLSHDVRRFFSQADKLGIEIYGTAQDFSQVDKSFRRLTTDLLHLVKVVGSRRPSATRPPVSVVWGLVAKFKLDPQGYVEDKKKYISYIPSFFMIRREFCELFDTGQEIKGGNYSPLKHIERECNDPRCLVHYGKPFKKIIHV